MGHGRWRRTRTRVIIDHEAVAMGVRTTKKLPGLSRWLPAGRPTAAQSRSDVLWGTPTGPTQSRVHERTSPPLNAAIRP